MTTEKPSQKAKKDIASYLILWGLLGGLFIHSFIKHGILNQAIGWMIPQASAQVPIVNSRSGFMPDWSRLRFSDMIVQESGSVRFPGRLGTETRTWSAGQSIAEFLELGDFEEADFGIERLNVQAIARTQGTNINTLRLSDFGLLKKQSIANLVQAVPSLRNRYVSQVPPIRDLLRRSGWGTSGRIGDIAQINGIRQLQLGRIDLSRYRLLDIPGVERTAIQRFANWQDTLIKDIPGLPNLTWNNFPSIPTASLAFIGKVDLPLGDLEANRIRSISGSYQEGFNVPCNLPSCAHFELSGFTPGATGAQWISGKSQQVRGGFGILRVVNGGREPTGRHPFGSAFKQVVWNINEAEGRVDTSMFFRICKRIAFVRTCTPYFIGPVPFINYREKDPIILGNPPTVP
ncbi:MAG: hypothetical protein KME59_19410 [Trichormus sp. ATA11-4-KO1]|jgi:hypothetical protein|nr:hypothetical protein [Trichormus sp. ATA11-4-KO1]